MDNFFEKERTNSIDEEDIDAAEEISIMKQKVSQRRRNTFLKRNRLLHLSKINPYNPRIYPYERKVWEKDDWKCINRPYAVRSHKDELIGCIRYSVDSEMQIAQYFGAINFSDDKVTFGRAICQVIDDCFLKFGMEVVEWCVICGNPVERSYDRMCKRLGGRIVGIRHKRAKDMAGNVHDDKLYEILREDYLNSFGKKESVIL